MYWLHVWPPHLVPSDCWDVIRLARGWREGVLPESGGMGDQAAWTMEAVEIVCGTWNKMRAAMMERQRRD